MSRPADESVVNLGGHCNNSDWMCCDVVGGRLVIEDKAQQRDWNVGEAWCWLIGDRLVEAVGVIRVVILAHLGSRVELSSSYCRKQGYSSLGADSGKWLKQKCPILLQFTP